MLVGIVCPTISPGILFGVEQTQEHGGINSAYNLYGKTW